MTRRYTIVYFVLMLIATTIMSACSGVRKIDRELYRMTDSRKFEKKVMMQKAALGIINK